MPEVELKEAFVRICTFDPETDKEESNKSINYANHEERIWLSKHMMWAINNGKGIEITPVMATNNAKREKKS